MGKPEEEHESEEPEASAVEDQAKTSRVGGRKQQLPDSECRAGISAVSHGVSGLSFRACRVSAERRLGASFRG